MTVELQWKTPPARPKQEYKLGDENQAISEALMQNPGNWALIKEDTYPSITTWWKNRPGFEAKSSKVGKTNGKWDVYARYVGE